MDDRFVASAGFVVAGLALVAAALDWTPAAAGFGLGSPVAFALAVVALVAFAARRYGVAGHRAALVAMAAFALVSVVAVVALVGPVVRGGDSPVVGGGLWLGFGLGIAGVGVAYADWLGLDRGALSPRVEHLVVASLVGFAGLVVGGVVAYLPLVVVGESLSPAVSFGLVTVLFSVGLGIVAAIFLASTEYGVGYLDLALPNRRGAVYAIGGVVAIFGLLIGLGLLTEALGIGGSESSIVEEARKNPAILLALVPLSYLAIATGEELLYRNVVQKYLGEAYSATAAVLLGCVVFTVMHVPTYYAEDPVAMFSTLVRLFALSLVLGVVYERTRNVVVPILVHGTFDAVQFAVLYLVLTGRLDLFV